MSVSSSDDMFEDDSDSEVSLNYEEELQKVKENDPNTTKLYVEGEGHILHVQWEEIGRDITNNTHLTELRLSNGSLDDLKMIFLFREGLTRSSSIKEVELYSNHFGVAGVRSMLPFLQTANNLTRLDVVCNNIQSEGFNLLFRALSDSPIEELDCYGCGIDSIEIDSENKPKYLKKLILDCNSIKADGCRQLAKLLRGEDASLNALSIGKNKIDDEGVEILAEALRKNQSLTLIDLSKNEFGDDGVAALAAALQSNTALRALNLDNNKIEDDGVEVLVDAIRKNTSLMILDLLGNDGISKQGEVMLLKLVNDISSIEATLRSNHALTGLSGFDNQIHMHVYKAINISSNAGSPEAAGRKKVIKTQLHSERRAELAALQGVNHSVYSEIDPLHLPEVLALVASHHGQGELYIALKSSIAGVISTVDRKECIRQKRDYYLAKAKQLDDELAAIETAQQGNRAEDGECCSSIRPLTWWELWSCYNM